MVKFRVYLLCLALVCALSFPGCSSNGTITVTLSPSTPPAINAGQSQNITATLTHDVKNQGVTWSLSGPGSLTNEAATSVTFVAPQDISAESTSTITATSVANTTATGSVTITVDPVLGITTSSLPVGTVGTPYVGVIGAIGATGTFTWTLTKGNLPAGLSLSSSTSSAVTILGTPTTVGTSDFTIQVVDSGGDSVSRPFSITINPPPPLSVATHTLPQGTVGIAYPDTTLQASSGTPPYSWMLINGTTLPPGLSLSSAGVISGTPTTQGQFPFSVQVTDSSSPQQTASASLMITINPSSAGNTQLSGNYAFLVSGFTGSSNSVTAGSFFADGNGNISDGLLDSNSNGGALTTAQAFTGVYVIGSNGLGTLTINGGTSTFAIAVSASGNGGKIIEFGSTTGSGVLLKQSGLTGFSTSSIVGDYAFGFLGVDAQAKRYGFAGQFDANSGVFNPGTLDSDDAGTLATNAAFTGTCTVTNAANGRGTIVLTVNSAVTNYSFYAVSPTQLLVMETDNIAGGSPLVSGSILQQSSNSFTDSSLDGTSVLETTALNASNQTEAQVGLFTTTGAGGSSLSGEENSGGTVNPTSGSGTYSVNSNGRVTLNGSGIASSDPVLYLVSQNQAFIVGTDSIVTSGFMESQSGVTLSAGYGGGSLPPVQASASDQVDSVTNTSGTLAFSTDITSGSGLVQQQSTGTCSLDNTGQCTLTGTGGTIGYIFVVSPSEFYELYANSQATLEDFQQ